jgi:multiple antibiotic resistance protein
MMHGMDILELAKAALALFAIVDPVGVIPIFLMATQPYARAGAASRCGMTVLGVLTLFTLSSPC